MTVDLYKYLEPGERIFQFIDGDNIFSTGCSLIPAKIQYADGSIKYIWIVDTFEDDSFMNGKNVDPSSFADSIDELYWENGKNE